VSGRKPGYDRVIVIDDGRLQDEEVKKRLLAGPLWLMAGWYAGLMIATYVGLSEALGPILGVAAAGVVVADPRRIIWE
jgi:hypothetical protein